MVRAMSTQNRTETKSLKPAGLEDKAEAPVADVAPEGNFELSAHLGDNMPGDKIAVDAQTGHDLEQAGYGKRLA